MALRKSRRGAPGNAGGIGTIDLHAAAAMAAEVVGDGDYRLQITHAELFAAGNTVRARLGLQSDDGTVVRHSTLCIVDRSSSGSPEYVLIDSKLLKDIFDATGTEWDQTQPEASVKRLIGKYIEVELVERLDHNGMAENRIIEIYAGGDDDGSACE